MNGMAKQLTQLAQSTTQVLTQSYFYSDITQRTYTIECFFGRQTFVTTFKMLWRLVLRLGK